MKAFEGWHHTLSDAIPEAKARQFPIVEVIQPKEGEILYSFGKGIIYKGRPKKYCVVTSAPKTLIAKLKRRGIKARVVSLKAGHPTKKKSSSWPSWLGL